MRNLTHVIVKLRPELNHWNAQIIGDFPVKPIGCASTGYCLLNGRGGDFQDFGQAALVKGPGYENHFPVDNMFVFVYHALISFTLVGACDD
jgi:hypothetical protein